MSIDEILEEMDELLDKASSVPFVSHKKVIDGERMRELINDVRLNMPHELKEAKKIEFDCQRILNEAKLNAENIIRKAEERAAQIVSREAIVTEAKKKALDMLTKAQPRPEQMRLAIETNRAYKGAADGKAKSARKATTKKKVSKKSAAKRPKTIRARYDKHV